MLRRIHNPERGANALEYAGLLMIAMAIVASVANAAQLVGPKVNSAVDSILDPTGQSSSENGGGEDAPSADTRADEGSGDDAKPGQPSGPGDDGKHQPSFLPKVPDLNVSPLDLAPGPDPMNAAPSKMVPTDGIPSPKDAAKSFLGFEGRMHKEAVEIGKEYAEGPVSLAKGLYNDPGETLKQAGKSMFYDAPKDYYEKAKKKLGGGFKENLEGWKEGDAGKIFSGWGKEMSFLAFDMPVGPSAPLHYAFPEEAREHYSKGEVAQGLARTFAGTGELALTAVSGGTGGAATKGAKGLKNLPKGLGDKKPKGKDPKNLADGDKNKEKPDKGKGCNSFVPGTPVVLADGSSAPIEDVQAGEKVLASDPTTGESGARTVTDHITGYGTKTLVTITIIGEDGTTDTLTATQGPAEFVLGG